MHTAKSTAAFFLLLAGAQGLLGGERQIIQGTRPAVAAKLTAVDRVPAATKLNLAIGLPLRDHTTLSELLREINTPGSPNYHQYLTAEQFAERFGPTEADYDALKAFARANGLRITATHSNRTLLSVNGSVEQVEKAFAIRMGVYRHPKEARTFYAPDREPSVDLAAPILDVSGLDNYVVPRPMNLRTKPVHDRAGMPANTGSGPDGTYIGNDFRTAYLPGVALTGAGQSVALVEFDGFYPNDITTYLSQAGLSSVPLKTVLLDGFDGTPASANVEVALDIQVAIAMAPGLSSVIVYEGFLPNDVLNRIATDNLARQISASWLYGIDQTTEQIFQQFAAQGQSFFNASGDGDAWVDFVIPPADDPYITSVGGTTLTTGPGGAWASSASASATAAGGKLPARSR